eukprot:6311400-Pyramimonas_sp.AAC.1
MRPLDALRSALRLYPTPLPATYTNLLYPVLQIKGCRRRATAASWEFAGFPGSLKHCKSSKTLSEFLKTTVRGSNWRKGMPY